MNFDAIPIRSITAQNIKTAEKKTTTKTFTPFTWLTSFPTQLRVLHSECPPAYVRHQDPSKDTLNRLYQMIYAKQAVLELQAVNCSQ